MKIVATALFSCALSLAAHADTCVAQAAAKTLSGAAKNSFLKRCTGDAVAASRTTCDQSAAEKKLAGAA